MAETTNTTTNTTTTSAAKPAARSPPPARARRRARALGSHALDRPQHGHEPTAAQVAEQVDRLAARARSPRTRRARPRPLRPRPPRRPPPRAATSPSAPRSCTSAPRSRRVTASSALATGIADRFGSRAAAERELNKDIRRFERRGKRDVRKAQPTRGAQLKARRRGAERLIRRNRARSSARPAPSSARRHDA